MGCDAVIVKLMKEVSMKSHVRGLLGNIVQLREEGIFHGLPLPFWEQEEMSRRVKLY